MILDKNLLFSDKQALRNTDVDSTNVIDLGASGQPIWKGEPLAVVVVITTGATGGTGLTVQVRQSDQLSGQSLGGSPEMIAISPGISVEYLFAGNRIILPLPVTPVDGARYLELFYDVSGSFTALSVTAALIPMRYADTWEAFADAQN